MDPKHVDDDTLEGFTIGGMTPLKLKSKYGRTSNPIAESTQSSPYRSGNPTEAFSSSTSVPSSHVSNLGSKDPRFENTRSFVLNEDMTKLRQAELVILKEEAKFGTFKRDPFGRIVTSMNVRGMSLFNRVLRLIFLVVTGRCCKNILRYFKFFPFTNLAYRLVI